METKYHNLCYHISTVLVKDNLEVIEGEEDSCLETITVQFEEDDAEEKEGKERFRDCATRRPANRDARRTRVAPLGMTGAARALCRS